MMQEFKILYYVSKILPTKLLIWNLTITHLTWKGNFFILFQFQRYYRFKKKPDADLDL